jgi:hypothetical protein
MQVEEESTEGPPDSPVRWYVRTRFRSWVIVGTIVAVLFAIALFIKPEIEGYWVVPGYIDFMDGKYRFLAFRDNQVKWYTEAGERPDHVGSYYRGPNKRYLWGRPDFRLSDHGEILFRTNWCEVTSGWFLMRIREVNTGREFTGHRALRCRMTEDAVLQQTGKEARTVEELAESYRNWRKTRPDTPGVKTNAL